MNDVFESKEEFKDGDKIVYVIAIVKVPKEEYSVWSEGSDITFHAAGHLHDPEIGVFVTHHSDLVNIDKEQFEKLAYKIFTPEGGV